MLSQTRIHFGCRITAGVWLLVAFASVGAADENRKPVDRKQWGSPKAGFHLSLEKSQLRLALDGKPIASYVFQHAHVKRPFFAHVKIPGGSRVTRNFPPIKGTDATDHATMHPGIWLAFGKLGGSDFWRNKGRVAHERFLGKTAAGRLSATFATINRYERLDGTVVCRQRTTYRISRHKHGWLLAVDARFSAKKPFAFGVQEEMGLGFRVATPLAVKNGGKILASHGGRNEKGTWGKAGRWWDYYGTLNRRRVGILLMSHPANGSVWSHSRDYGCLVANPFPVDRKENRGKTTVVKPGADYRLRFGILVHESSPGTGIDRKAAYESYVGKQVH